MHVEGTYGRWARWLSLFAQGQANLPEGLPAMDGRMLGVEVAVRIAQKTSDAVNARVSVWSEDFSRALRRLASPDELRAAVLLARQRFAPIWNFAHSPLLLPELRDALEAQLTTAVIAQQAALEDSIWRSSPTMRESLLLATTDTPLIAALDRMVAEESLPNPAPGHRVMLPSQSPEGVNRA